MYKLTNYWLTRTNNKAFSLSCSLSYVFFTNGQAPLELGPWVTGDQKGQYSLTFTLHMVQLLLSMQSLLLIVALLLFSFLSDLNICYLTVSERCFLSMYIYFSGTPYSPNRSTVFEIWSDIECIMFTVVTEAI